jgi:hypothetical protein
MAACAHVLVSSGKYFSLFNLTGVAPSAYMLWVQFLSSMSFLGCHLLHKVTSTCSVVLVGLSSRPIITWQILASRNPRPGFSRKDWKNTLVNTISGNSFLYLCAHIFFFCFLLSLQIAAQLSVNLVIPNHVICAKLRLSVPNIVI